LVGFDVLQQQINLIRRFLSNAQTPDSGITLVAHAIYLDADAVRIEIANGLRGDRPWVLKRHKRFTANIRR
jgi:hypothetical protein